MKEFFYAHLIRNFSKTLIVCTICAVSLGLCSDASILYLPLEGDASWYSEFSPGVKPTTANMEIFNHDKMTCASWDFPFGTILEVTNQRNGRKVLVRVNDRGPAKRLYKGGRIIDLAMAAFCQIEDLDKGLASVRIRVVR
jgi:rare lipoprotein A